jgi:hypothetical protein
MQLNGIGINVNNKFFGDGGNGTLQITSSQGDGGLYGKGSGGQFNYQLYGDGGTNYGFLNGRWASWDLRKVVNSTLYNYYNGPGYVVLDGLNYNGYAPTLTGGNASGTWSISITGGATYLNSSNYINQRGSQGNWNQDFYNTPAGNLSYGGDVNANTSSNPGGTWWMEQNFRHTNGSNYWGTQIAWGWEDNANRLATRNISNGNFGGWVYYLNSSNYNSYSPTLTGGNASGTWYISLIYGYLQPYGVGGNSGQGAQYYSQYQVSGPWNGSAIYGYAHPKLIIAFHTGIMIGGYYGYGGTRFYNNSPEYGSVIGSFGEGDQNFRAYNDIIAYASDRRLKDNIVPITDAMRKVNSITGVTFDWKPMVKDLGFTPNKWHDAGVIAQEINAVLPEAVEIAPFDWDFTAENGTQSKSGKMYLTVKYEKIVPLLIEAIKEQQIQINTLKERYDKDIAELQEFIRKL